MKRLANRVLILGFVLGTCLAMGAAVRAAETVTWEDLTPPFDESLNPLYGLNEDQQNSLFELIWGRDLRRGFGESAPLSDEEQAARRLLLESGKDPDALLAQVDDYNGHISLWNESLVDDLDGREIQIAGYALPLELSGTAVTEFLLVPYVGACIHVPPPPTNQMVHVRIPAGYESEELYEPVWVTGRITNRPQSVSLSLVDGSFRRQRGLRSRSRQDRTVPVNPQLRTAMPSAKDIR